MIVVLDLTHFGKNQLTPQGRLMALLILEMEKQWILQVKVEDIQLDFHVIQWAKMAKNVLKVPEPLLEELQLFLDECLSL